MIVVELDKAKECMELVRIEMAKTFKDAPAFNEEIVTMAMILLKGHLIQNTFAVDEKTVTSLKGRK